MKILSCLTIATLAFSTITAQAWNGPRHRGPMVGPRGPVGPQYHRPPTFRPPAWRPPVARPPIMRPPMHRPPPWRPPVVRPPIVRPPIGYPPPMLPPNLPPPIIEPVVPVYPDPGYPIPNPIPDPIEEQAIYGLPAHVYVQDPCDPLQYQVPVVNTIPAQSVYCSNAYINVCSQMFNGYQVYPYNIPAPGICQVRPTYNGSWVLIVNNSTVLAERRSHESIARAYRNSVRMGICR